MGGGAEERERDTELNFVYGFTYSAFLIPTLSLARSACGDSVSEGEDEDESKFREQECRPLLNRGLLKSTPTRILGPTNTISSIYQRLFYLIPI